MRKSIFAILSAFFAPLGAFATNEGVPSYYQQNAAQTANQAAYNRQYSAQGYSQYVGQSGNKQVVGSRTYSYQVPRQTTPNLTTATSMGAMTPNGIAMPTESDKAFNVYGGYNRRFADFEFRTGVNSVLEWDDMVFNEFTVGARYNFSLRNFDLMAYGEYTYGDMAHGGLSMDYDLEPYTTLNPGDGIFTVSVGDQSGHTDHFRFGMGARHIWDIGGWKLTPIIGYEIFKHNLKMSDHYYPNQGVYIPLMTDAGNYVFGYTDPADLTTYFYSVPVGSSVDSNWYQVCMSPEDIKVVGDTTGGVGGFLGNVTSTEDWVSTLGDVPWGVPYGECVVIGGDGPILIDGTTHIYNTTWSGFYVALEIEKQMTLADKLRLYMQFSLPKYSSEGTWPRRDDWQQNPSFIDEGSNGSYAYAFELEYDYRLSERLQLALKAETNYFHVGRIPGKLYVAPYSEFVAYEDDLGNVSYVLETTAAHTENITDSLKEANWQSFGLHLGVKYSF